jgi:hypothetical protein
MFTRTFSVGKNRAFRLAVSLVLALGLVVGALSLVGCGEEEDETGNLVGTWKNIYDPGGPSEYITTIHITDNTVVYENNYEGTIENDPNFDAEYGVLIIKFTKYLTPDYSNYPEVEYTKDPTKEGKYAALYWKDLFSSSVLLADAYDTSSADPKTGTGAVHKIVDDIVTAKATFTNDVVSNFVTWSGVTPYNKY